MWIKGDDMALALEYLLMSRMREEANIAGPKYLVWQSLFPMGFTAVANKASKSSNLGAKSPDKVLGDFADEWEADPSKADFVSVAREIGTHARKTGGAGDREAHELYCALSEAHEEDGKLKRAKRQLMDAVVECLTRTSVTVTRQRAASEKEESVRCVLASIIENGYLDPWSYDDLMGEMSVDMRGLSFLFTSSFKESFTTFLRREFGWKDDYYFSKFASEIEFCQWTYMSGELEDEESLELMRSIVAMYILASLVGPGTFAGELGCAQKTFGTVRGTQAFSFARKKVIKYQLQPIVFNGQGPWSYFTDDADPIVFTSDEIVRFGREDRSDPHWLEEHRGVALSDRSISRKHAQLEHRGNEWVLTDLASANGTIVLRGYNGGKIFRSSGFSDAERGIQVSTGDLFFFGPSGGYRHDVRSRSASTPSVEPFVRGKAFRFERIEK